MLDRLSSCSASFPKSRTSIKVKSAQLPARFVVGLHYQTQCIIISEKMDEVSQNYFCKTAIYTQNFHYKGRGGNKGKSKREKERVSLFLKNKKYSWRLLRIHLYEIFRATMLVFMKHILSKGNRFGSAGKQETTQMTKMQSIASKFLQLKLILSVPHCKYLCFPVV